MPLASAPKRLQRLLLRLQQYDVDLRYKPGSEMYLADTLSIAFLKSTIQSKAEEEAETIHATDFVPISEPQLREIQAETAQDDTLQQLKKTIIFKGQCCMEPTPEFKVASDEQEKLCIGQE